MSKYIFKSTGEEIKLGEAFLCYFTKDVIEGFKKLGLVKEIKEKPVPEIHTSARWYIDKLKKRLGIEEHQDFVDIIKVLNKGIAPYFFPALLKEVALELDQKYDGHISSCKEIYTVSLTDGKIYKQDATKIKYFKFISAFRTREDAEFALTVLQPLVTSMFNDEQENKKCHS